MSSLSVVVPSYRRPDSLARALAALSLQHLPPKEIIVVARAHDRDTIEMLATYAAVRTVTVDEPGVLAAMAAGNTTVDAVAVQQAVVDLEDL